MKHADVNLGHEYLARVSGELVRVKVITQTVRRGFAGRRDQPVFRCRNMKTGKEVVRSAAALRPAVANETKAAISRIMVECADLSAAVKTSRELGMFDRAVALAELRLALIVERGEGPRTRLARAVIARESVAWHE